LVDVFPILKHVPEWVPGAGFQVQAKKWREMIVRTSEESYAAMIKAIVEFQGFNPAIC
jgi:hypothetical protein